MPKQLYILFCESPLNRNKVDPDFESEFLSATENGFCTLLFNFDELVDNKDAELATKRIKPNGTLTDVVYRGWMLTPDQYSTLYHNLLAKNYRLINNKIEYQNCHYLPDSLKFISAHTPKTIFESASSESFINTLIAEAKAFGSQPIIIKDYVKSEKHHWQTACFVSQASNTAKLKETIDNLIRLRGDYLNEGIVIREFLELSDLTIHSKSGMPLKEEYRLFFCHKKLIGIYNYWEEGEYLASKPDTEGFEVLAQGITSNFFSMDIARQKNGNLIIIELGDGQVSGIPDHTDQNEFYKNLWSCLP
ncbi:ATP-grasp domain-containing protein [Mucilaginibacter paludis]|uniref:ATP-grasp domain-containing protein n=1 Tax=Mucilaginibacter paludis DSM 18603 TaxID=714943 RepID=H1YB19_9SPHI|nr:ATP-grasp domain-containing protein [Mucilaginibacter paludis]EHQ30052.1 hypothetical protein Mucpa_5993 [Mucilaginibacter paludis DSM 18603]